MNQPDDRSGLVREVDEFSCSIFISKTAFELDGSPTTQIIICILMIPTYLAAALANLLMIISIWRTPSLHSPSNILLAGLAFSDLGVGLVTDPAFMTSAVAKIKQEADLFCKARQAAWISGLCLCFVSLFTLTAISLDRYIAIHLHLRYQEIVTVKRTLTVLIMIWIAGSICSLLYGLDVLIVPYLTIFFMFLSLAIIIFASCSIYRVVLRHQAQITAQLQVQTEHSEGSSLNFLEFKKSFMNMLILCWSLLLCYLPYIIVFGIILTTGLTPSKQSALEFSILLVNFNSALNPFLYCWRYQPIRAALKKLVRDLFCKNSAQ